MSNLTYFKCSNCLHVFTSEVTKVDACICGGNVARMGHVHGNKYIDLSKACACDGRCTNAQGPSCDCSCQGKNHGSGLTVPVIMQEGKVCMTILNDEIRAEIVVRAAMWTDARDAAWKRLQAKYGTITGYNPSYARDKREYMRILRLKVHGLRMKQMTAFLNEVVK